MRFASCLVLILVWIFIYEALGICIIGIYVAVF